jgi:hypothetical protein
VILVGNIGVKTRRMTHLELIFFSDNLDFKTTD